MRALIGNQYIICVMRQNPALHTSLAEACGTLQIFASWLFVSPYNRQCSLRVVHRQSMWLKKLEQRVPEHRSCPTNF